MVTWMGTETLLGSILTYWDKDEVRHDHDENVSVSEFGCSNGHSFKTRTTYGCKGCETLDSTTFEE